MVTELRLQVPIMLQVTSETLVQPFRKLALFSVRTRLDDMSEVREYTVLAFIIKGH